MENTRQHEKLHTAATRSDLIKPFFSMLEMSSALVEPEQAHAIPELERCKCRRREVVRENLDIVKAIVRVMAEIKNGFE